MSHILERRVTAVEAADRTLLDVTAGTAAASKALVLNSSSGITSGLTLLTATTVTAGTITPTAINVWNTQRQTADVVVDLGEAAASLTGLVQTVVAGTYKYEIVLQALSTANAGLLITMTLTTAVLTSIQNIARAFTATGVACARSTTGTSGATLYGATAAITQIVMQGTMVVSTGGTIQLVMDQNANHADESTVYAGSTFSMQRIA